eukprot:3368208-Pyramimonas_sp.AAC.3
MRGMHSSRVLGFGFVSGIPDTSGLGCTEDTVVAHLAFNLSATSFGWMGWPLQIVTTSRLMGHSNPSTGCHAFADQNLHEACTPIIHLGPTPWSSSPPPQYRATALAI